MLKRRVEPISSLYVDVVVPVVEGAAAPSAAPVAPAPSAAPVAPAVVQAPATGAIIGRRVLKLKKTATAASAAAGF